MQSFDFIHYNMFNMLYDDLGQICGTAKDLMNETEESMSYCTALAEPEVASACLRELHQLFIIQKEDFLQGIIEVTSEVEDALVTVESTQEQMFAENIEYIAEHKQTARDEIIECIESL